MKSHLLPACCLLAATACAGAADSALTIYNQNFAVVRTLVPLDLKAGLNDVKTQNVTAQVEPGSVILRDPAGGTPLRIREQSYRNDPVSQGLLLSLFEGKTVDFLVREPNKPDRIVPGKIIRSGYVSPTRGGSSEAIVEIDGTVRFGLPGLPIFPSLGDDTILKPQLSWTLDAAKPVKLDAELGYVTGGFTWSADYNIVASAKGDTLDLVGWVTMNNSSGTTFENARIKLMAGDVNKLEPATAFTAGLAKREQMVAMAAAQPDVTEKAFDEYHLYTLAHPATLRDGETKQVEFVRTSGIKSEKIYVYDGLNFDWNRWRGYGRENLRRNEEIGGESDTKVAVVREFKNSEANKLGLPLPAGRLRFYQQDDDGQLEFLGENEIDHTPKNETIRVTTGNAFDIVGERKRTAFQVDTSNHWVDETIEIKLRNHKKEPVEVRVVEHLFRWTNWELTKKSTDFQKLNADQIEFRVSLKPDEEKTVTYTVHYSW